VRLADLNPKWTTPVRFSVELPTGISFLCPCCKELRLSVPFNNPIDPDSLLAATNWQASQPAWHRTGDTFDTLSLLPSIDYSASGHWHGHISNGAVVTP
jgi:hypothetical protein